MITYRAVRRDDHDQVRELLINVGWAKRVQDPARFEQMLHGASRTVVACEETRIVGFARALFDGASNGYISTVAVSPDFQRQGIGREMVRRLMACERPERMTWVLRSAHASRAFWERLGFKPSEEAMEIVRTE
jgi:ribosomal protein S18 acetylase RimI-like enzyme